MNRSFLIILILLALFSCKKQEDKLNWDVDILGPLVETTMSLDQLVADSLLEVNPDHSVSLVYTTKLAELSLDTIFELPDTSVSYGASLNSITVGPIEVSESVSLGMIAENDLEENGPVGGLYELLMTAHNTGQPNTITPINPMSFDSLEIDAGDYFQTITIGSGFIDIKIENNLPITLTNIIFELKNKSNGFVLVRDSFLVIPPYSSATRTQNLAGLTMENQMEGSVTISSPGSGVPVAIDTSFNATASITVRDVQIDSAIARFPSQEILELNSEAVFTAEDIQLAEAWIRAGMIEVKVFNTLGENLNYNFRLPGVRLNNQPLSLTGSIPAGSPSNPSETTISQNLAGYRIDFRGIGRTEMTEGDLNGNGIIDPDTVNSLHYELSGSIDSSGNFIQLTKFDSINISCSFTNLIPDYARGYFGNRTVSLDSMVNFSILSGLTVGNLSLDQVNLSLEITNQIGVTAQAVIHELTSYSSQTGNSVSLTGSAVSTPFFMLKPIDPHTTALDVNPTRNIFLLNSQNSNINSLISNIPDRFGYNLEITLNPGITPPPPGAGTDFVYYGDRISGVLNVEIPLSLIASDLVLRDTIESDFPANDVEGINYGSLILFTDNMFPIEGYAQIFMLDSNRVVIDSLSATGIGFQAATYNPFTHLVTSAVRTKSTVPVSRQKLDAALGCKYFVIVARFNTRPDNVHVKIYDYYTVKFQLIGDFNYTVNP